MGKRFGIEVRYIREAHKKTLRFVSGELGVSTSNLSDIEHSRRPPLSLEHIKKFAQLFDVDVKGLYRLAAEDRKKIEIPLEGLSPEAREAVFSVAVAAHTGSLDAGSAQKVSSLLRG